jgi:hypothetical protein
MPSKNVQIHIVISTDTRMATRAYGRDEKGWYCEMSTSEHCDGAPVTEHETEPFDLSCTDHAVADALMAVHAAFGVMLEPGERLPNLVPVELKAPTQGSTLN